MASWGARELHLTPLDLVRLLLSSLPNTENISFHKRHLFEFHLHVLPEQAPQAMPIGRISSLSKASWRLHSFCLFLALGSFVWG